jgi:hypothetical protein
MSMNKMLAGKISGNRGQVSDSDKQGVKNLSVVVDKPIVVSQPMPNYPLSEEGSPERNPEEAVDHDTPIVNNDNQGSSTGSRQYPMGKDNRELWDEEEDELVQGNRKVKDIFCVDRVKPVLQTTAELSGLEYVDDTEVCPNSWIYGSLGLANKNEAILQMPNELVAEVTRTNKSKKWFKAPQRIFDMSFRVSNEDHKKFFYAPSLDNEVADIMKQYKNNKIDCFSRFWEEELFSLDKHVKTLERLSVFQASIINALAIDLQPLDDQTQCVSDFAIPAAQLAGDMAAHTMRQSIKLSHRICQLRRQNVCAGLKGYIEKVTDALLDIPYDHKPELLFGGLYDKTSRTAAKKQDSEDKTRTKVYKAAYRPPSQNYRSRGGGMRYEHPQPQPQMQYSRGGSSNYTRGQKRKQEYQADHSRRAGPKRARGRGRSRGHAQSRL